MRYLGLDLGTTTQGLATTDKTNQIASPLKTIRFANEDYESVLPELEQIIKEKKITKLILGLPKNMNNSLGYASERSVHFKNLLEQKFSLPVVLVDERLSTVEAEKILLSTDTSRKMRKKQIDGLAASLILETYLKRKEEME